MTRNIIKALAVLALLMLLLFFLSPFLSTPPSGHNAPKPLQYARETLLACRCYALDHNGDFPKQLNDLIPNYLDSESHLVDTSSKKPMWNYHPGNKLLINIKADRKLVIESNFWIKKGVVVPLSVKNAKKIYGFTDGSTLISTDKAFSLRFPSNVVLLFVIPPPFS
ncbi:MAG: hypothetical protein L3J39_05285 [Verrucomicrobiales bacterium]|nr:hypothetical protein [Verrucomicrobiales bacterium]